MIKEITNQQEWTDFFNKVGALSFHQSWEWGEFQQKLGYMILRLGIYEDRRLAGIALVVKIHSKRGHFLFIPHGPLFDLPSRQLAQQINDSNMISRHLNTLIEYLKDLANREHYWFIRISPSLLDTQEHRELYKNLGFRTAPIYMHAERMEVLSLVDENMQPIAEQTLLSEMRKTTRYSIRKSEKEGVTIEERTDEHAVDDFWKLYKTTSERGHFTPFSKQFIIDEYNTFNDVKNAAFLFAKHGNTYLAGALVLFTRSSGFYHQGASVPSKLPAPYLLQWHAIQLAKSRGCHYYNFWGTFRAGRTPKSWQGLSLFKQGFGGKPIDYMETQDVILSPRYYLSFAIDTFLKLKRGI